MAPVRRGRHRTELKVELLNAGWMTAARGIWRTGEEEPERPIRVPVPVYLIETESERILVDTGLSPDAVADKEAHYGPGPIAFFELEQERPLVEQVDLDTLTMVVLTHLHFDHAGGLALIPPSVPVVVQRAEWEGGQDRAAIERNFFLPRDYAECRPSSLSSTVTTTCSATARSSSSALRVTPPATSPSASATSSSAPTSPTTPTCSTIPGSRASATT